MQKRSLSNFNDNAHDKLKKNKVGQKTFFDLIKTPIFIEGVYFFCSILVFCDMMFSTHEHKNFLFVFSMLISINNNEKTVLQS